MAASTEVLVFDCPDDDLAVLSQALQRRGVVLRTTRSTGELARDAVRGCPLAVVLGVGIGSLANLDVLSVIRAVRSELPVIVVAVEDSLELERRARQNGIFYYLVHPVERSEVEAVTIDLMRTTRERRRKPN